MCPTWLTECFCPAQTNRLSFRGGAAGRDIEDEDSAEIGMQSSRTIEDSLKIDTGGGNGSSYKIKQLFNRHGYNLAILQGHVRGTAVG